MFMRLTFSIRKVKCLLGVFRCGKGFLLEWSLCRPFFGLCFGC